MSKPRATRLACYAVITNESKLLVCRLSEGMANKGKWTLPGGGLEFGETLEDAVVREVFEETGLNVRPKNLALHTSRVWPAPHEDLHLLQFLFRVELLSGELQSEVNGTTDLAEWVEIATLTEENAVDIVHHALEIAKRP